MTGPTRHSRSRGRTRPTTRTFAEDPLDTSWSHRRSSDVSSLPTPGSPAPLRSTDEALEVVRLVVPEHTPAVIAVPLDDDHVGRHLWCVEHTVMEDDAIVVARMVVAATEGCTRLVLGSSRPFDGCVPQSEDFWRWSTLQLLLAEEGVIVLDWFVLGALDQVVSMAELDDLPESRWMPG